VLLLCLLLLLLLLRRLLRTTAAAVRMLGALGRLLMLQLWLLLLLLLLGRLCHLRPHRLLLLFLLRRLHLFVLALPLLRPPLGTLLLLLLLVRSFQHHSLRLDAPSLLDGAPTQQTQVLLLLLLLAVLAEPIVCKQPVGHPRQPLAAAPLQPHGRCCFRGVLEVALKAGEGE
jgi:hypothetical protein